MKPKKAKKHRPNVYTDFRLSDDACRALSEALLFLMNLKDFSFEDEKISFDSASEAEQKLSNRETVLTRGEVRASAKAIDIVLLRLLNNVSEYAYMDEDYPMLLVDLEKDRPLLEQLQPIFQIAVKDLRRMR